MSNITAMVEPNKRSLVVVCHGLNMQLTENVVSTHTVNILCKLMNANNKFLINWFGSDARARAHLYSTGGGGGWFFS